MRLLELLIVKPLDKMQIVWYTIVDERKAVFLFGSMKPPINRLSHQGAFRGFLNLKGKGCKYHELLRKTMQSINQIEIRQNQKY